MTSPDAAPVPFPAALRRSFAKHAGASSALAAEIGAILDGLPADDVPPVPSPRRDNEPVPAVINWLGPAIAAARGGPERELATAIAAFAGDLAWTFGYAPDPRRSTLAEAIAFADIAGKAGILPADGIVTGLTLLAPSTYYPLHVHPAVEHYLVLSGTAEWTAGTASAQQPPGTLILHPSDLPHAMKTGTEPLLALFIWSGDIASPSRFIE